MIHRQDYFNFMQNQIKRTATKTGDQLPQAFGRWFSNMYFPGVTNIMIPDGAGDGKVDLFVTCQDGNAVRYRILNCKFTETYDKASPVAFYDEITRYWQAFRNTGNRSSYLNTVNESLRPHFKKLFKLYDDNSAKLYFVTNHRKNEKQYSSVQDYEDVVILHLDDVLHYVAEHMDDAMPETDPLVLSAISNVLEYAEEDAALPTSIVFARLIDFVNYMEHDPFDLLFARNVRVYQGGGAINREIQRTFRNAPQEFAYSNNGITIICDKHDRNLGKHELILKNPRVVNGSQTLHSIREVENPSSLARVMVRIIEVPVDGSNPFSEQVQKKKEIIQKISIRSNQQNPVRGYNLVANDPFQHDLSRYFHDKGWFYERRLKEWKEKKLQLMSVGIQKGPNIKWMTQIIAAFHYEQKKLGPAVARGSLNDLFKEETYSVIQKTPPIRAYQLFLLAELNDWSLHRLSDKKQYIRNLKGYVDFCSFAWLCRILREIGIAFGKENLNQILEREYETDQPGWEMLVKGVVDLIYAEFKRAAAFVSKRDGIKLTPANYFKNATLVGKLMARSVPGKLRKEAEQLLK